VEVTFNMRKTPFLERKDAIRRELLKWARKGRLVTYSDLGRAVGVPTRGPWKPVLDLISTEESERSAPDLTFLVKNKQTGLPSQIGFVGARFPTPDQVEKARNELRRVFDKYCPGARMPF
jgi:hypothetical protein